MAALRSGLTLFSSFLSEASGYTTSGLQQVRHKYLNRWMKRDDLRRKLAVKHAKERLCLVALKRNDILPQQIKDDAGKVIDETIPRQTALRQLNARCILTSRGHGLVYKYRVSRIVFRAHADANLLCGVQRGIW